VGTFLCVGCLEVYSRRLMRMQSGPESLTEPGQRDCACGWQLPKAGMLHASLEIMCPVLTCAVVALCCLCACAGPVQVRMVEAAKEKLQKDMRSSSSKNLAALVSVQA
jgi:hypothetical protein